LLNYTRIDGILFVMFQSLYYFLKASKPCLSELLLLILQIIVDSDDLLEKKYELPIFFRLQISNSSEYHFYDGWEEFFVVFGEIAYEIRELIDIKLIPQLFDNLVDFSLIQKYKIPLFIWNNLSQFLAFIQCVSDKKIDDGPNVFILILNQPYLFETHLLRQTHRDNCLILNLTFSLNLR